ncbi:hypothetical protein K1X13_05305 [Nocardioides sp. WL0053]|uniref:Uncharacterized protein n=1 Tax=Nocardioides jiangsuensis TaxID=2866161 RepID=A0ABS7RGR7_9ACTN|nr:hypothetical protein [Nocardioides jiangsuensis]MBY9074235.1 hypothetical protein [Nocardioides jiangsuensis]
MSQDRFFDLYGEIERVVVPAAQLEQALGTLAYAVLGGDEAAHEQTHARPPSQLRQIIEPEARARTGEWWSEPALDLLTRAGHLLEARHKVVHGYWTDLRGIADGRSFITFKPDRSSKSWDAQYFDLSQLRQLAQQLEESSEQPRDLADRLVDEVHGR